MTLILRFAICDTEFNLIYLWNNEFHWNGQIVVAQYYEADVNKEHVIRGNAAIIKCLIPSFVADFVEVVSWHTDQDETFYPDNNYGSSLSFINDLKEHFHCFHL